MFQVIFSAGVVACIILVPIYLLQYSVFYFPVSLFIFFWVTYKKLYSLSEYLKLN